MQKLIESEFPLVDSVLYLNHAGVAPWPRRTSEAVKRFAEENCRTGARDYSDWLMMETGLRAQLKTLINAPDIGDIALVKNTSEALSFVALGLPWRAGDNIVSSDEEFPSNRIPWESLQTLGVEFRQAHLTDRAVPEQALFDLTDANTRLITISSIQFASGLRLNVERIGDFCRRHHILFCIDAIQSIGAVEFDVQACRPDFAMADGHKWMLGPEGLGVFYSTPDSRERLKLTQFGWHMIEDPGDYRNRPWTIAEDSRRFECGSANMLGIHALSASLSLLLEVGMDIVENKVLENAVYLKQLIRGHNDLELMTPMDSRHASGIVLFRHRKIENNALYRILREQGVVCAQRGGGIRFSPHFYTSQETIEKAIQIATQAKM
ncbi:MAG: aminotransferase class V-fold PLP-dependent enzyme [Methylococcaceae bacterium]|nr:aminotransferase class V-fold PLP-dependent enzyme [Methylococcaceae bacterium]MCI0668576.1 aminotransferase class V-fold PLP-dependent enzyme [Methylococcaceae bacterium]MCI0734180.1 aminotransferase class V-fold PLP-dependent enzyme [Methylococcaceae bacterium]